MKITEAQEKQIIQIIFEYGAGMVNDEVKLFTGNLKPEEAEETQGKKTAEAVAKIVDFIESITK